MSATGPEFDHEAMFAYWYRDGQRRTYKEVADQFGAGYSTVRRYSDDNDWPGRAGKLDDEIRVQLDAQIAAGIVRQRATNVQIARALLSRFAQRLADTVPDGNGGTMENPHALNAGELTVRDFDVLSRYVELMGGHATHRLGVETEEDRIRSLAELEEEIAALELAELPAGVPVDAVDDDGFPVEAMVELDGEQPTGDAPSGELEANDTQGGTP